MSGARLQGTEAVARGLRQADYEMATPIDEWHDDLMQIPRSENRENPLSDGQRPVGEVEHREGGNDEACSGERRSHLDSRLSVRGLRMGM